MQTLSNGYLLPDSGDRGNVFFPALEQNIQRVNDHSHNGSDSNILTAEAITGITDTINPGDWVLQANGLYRAPLTMPGNKLFDSTTIGLRANNKPLFGDIEKVTSNTLYVYVNDSSLTVTVLYL